MNDRVRIQFAAACSAFFHLLLLVLLAYGPKGGSSALASVGEPLVIQLQPQSPKVPIEGIERLVSPGTPATAPAPDTDQISTRDSKASDMSNTEGDGHAPAVDKVSNTITSGGGVSAPASAGAPPSRPVDGQDGRTADNSSETNEQPLSKPPDPAEPQKDATPRISVTENRGKKPTDKPGDKDQNKTVAAFDIAKAETPPTPPSAASQTPTLDAGPSSGLIQGGVKNPGFLGFEAKKSEYAPYLQEIKRRVEKRWRTTLQLRYSGTASTQAVVDCAISPDGKLVSVQIVDPGNSVSYAPLCRDSIEKAAPFPAFPFTVPEAYRSKNLEIRWTFSFM